MEKPFLMLVFLPKRFKNVALCSVSYPRLASEFLSHLLARR